MVFHQFQGARQRQTPVSTFSAILRILALVPGPQGDALRKAQAELSARSVAGDHYLEAGRVITDMSDHVLMETHSVSESLTRDNPVLRNPLMQLKAADFQSCRITPAGLISVIDAIMYVRGSSKENTKKVWLRLYQGDNFVPLRISRLYSLLES